MERVQEFAAKVISKNWSATGSDLVLDLGWPPLQVGRRYLRSACAGGYFQASHSSSQPSFNHTHLRRLVKGHVNSKSEFEMNTTLCEHYSILEF